MVKGRRLGDIARKVADEIRADRRIILAAAADANPGPDAYGLALSSNHAYSVAFNGYALG